jgi:GPH family glycoside/pentoside/hexuronide:cation symporter
LETIRLFIGPIPAVILAISIVIVYFYPISRERHLKAREELALRQEEQIDPGDAGADLLVP